MRFRKMLFHDYVFIKTRHALERTRTSHAAAVLLGFLFLFDVDFFFFFLQVAANAATGYVDGGANGLQCRLDKVDQTVAYNKTNFIVVDELLFLFCSLHCFSAII